MVKQRIPPKPTFQCNIVKTQQPKPREPQPKTTLAKWATYFLERLMYTATPIQLNIVKLTGTDECEDEVDEDQV